MLYFVLRGSHVGPVDLESVYQYLVPDQYKKELKSVGVMGGISMGVRTPGLFEEQDYPKLTSRRIIPNQVCRPFSFILATLQTP